MKPVRPFEKDLEHAAFSAPALAAACRASAEVARFDAEAPPSCGPALLRLECMASARIEGLRPSVWAVATAEVDPEATSDEAQQVARLMAAVRAAQDPDLSAKAVLATLGEGVGVAPSGDGELVELLGRRGLPALLQAAACRAACEATRPFGPHSGLVARALPAVVLARGGLLHHAVLPLSAVTEPPARGGAEGMALQMSAAALAALAVARGFVSETDRLRADFIRRVPARRGSGARQLADILPIRPVVGTAVAGAALGRAPGNLARAFVPLAKAGILSSFPGTNKAKLWKADEVLAVTERALAQVGQSV